MSFEIAFNWVDDSQRYVRFCYPSLSPGGV